VVAVTTVFGNVRVEQATANASRLFRLCQVERVRGCTCGVCRRYVQPPPIYAGAAHPLIGEQNEARRFGYVHGVDGLGGRWRMC
jgi:inosine-uridine nucleoside N-ribohydrolase